MTPVGRKRKRKVWVVSNGENHEGGTVVGVYSSKELAVKKALEVPPHFDGGWEPLPEPLAWGNGCDYVIVEEFPVEEL